MTVVLTGLRTHRDGLQEELVRRQAMCCLVDIDGLIWVNDQFGHQEGDRVLALVAHYLQDATRESGASVFRVGGDDFLIVLPPLDSEAVLGIAANIVSGVRALRIPYRRTDRPDRTVLEVNVAILRASEAFARAAFSQSGITNTARDLIGEAVYREKLRSGCEAGIVIDLSDKTDFRGRSDMASSN